ncbi:hypothetical protein BH11MYX4_BH11MYX4_49420 [soil metagenome]
MEHEECADIVGCLLQTAAGERASMCVSFLDDRPLSEVPADARRLAVVGVYIEWKMRQLLELRNRESN